MKSFKLPETGPAVWRVDVGQSDPALAELWMQNNAGLVKHFVAGQRQHIALGTAQIWRKSIEIDNLKVTYTNRQGQEVIDIRPSASVSGSQPVVTEEMPNRWLHLKHSFSYNFMYQVIALYRITEPRYGDLLCNEPNVVVGSGFSDPLNTPEGTRPRYAHFAESLVSTGGEDTTLEYVKTGTFEAWFDLKNLFLDYGAAKATIEMRLELNYTFTSVPVNITSYVGGIPKEVPVPYDFGTFFEFPSGIVQQAEVIAPIHDTRPYYSDGSRPPLTWDNSSTSLIVEVNCLTGVFGVV